MFKQFQSSSNHPSACWAPGVDGGIQGGLGARGGGVERSSAAALNEIVGMEGPGRVEWSLSEVD